MLIAPNPYPSSYLYNPEGAAYLANYNSEFYSRIFGAPGDYVSDYMDKSNEQFYGFSYNKYTGQWTNNFTGEVSYTDPSSHDTQNSGTTSQDNNASNQTCTSIKVAKDNIGGYSIMVEFSSGGYLYWAENPIVHLLYYYYVQYLVETYSVGRSGTSVNWGEVGSSSVGLLLGVGEITVGAGGEIPSAGVSTALIIDGGIRVGSNATKLYFLFKGDSKRGVATPSNAGGWIGKIVDVTSGSSYNEISMGQGVGSFVNDFMTFVVSGGSGLSLSKALMYPSVTSVYSYGLIITGTPYTVYSDLINWQNPKK